MVVSNRLALPLLPHAAPTFSGETKRPNNRQSHLVNARTSEDWFEQNAGHTVRGRLRWLSPPVKVVRNSRAQSATALKGQISVDTKAQNSVEGEGEGGEGGGGGGEGEDHVEDKSGSSFRTRVPVVDERPRPTGASVSLTPEVEEESNSNMVRFTLVFLAVGMLAFGLLVRSRRKLSGGATNGSAVS